MRDAGYQSSSHHGASDTPRLDQLDDPTELVARLIEVAVVWCREVGIGDGRRCATILDRLVHTAVNTVQVELVDAAVNRRGRWTQRSYDADFAAIVARLDES